MLKNNNQSAMKRLTQRSVKNNRTRNIFAVIAIILTTFMISSIFSIGISFADSYSTMTKRMAGTVASITLNNPTPDQTAKIQEISGVKAAGLRIPFGEAIKPTTSAQQQAAQDEENQSAVRLNYFDQTEFEKNYTPCISDIQGAYPSAKNEIMLSRSAMKALDITAPSIGMEIPLTYMDTRGQKTEAFRLSGYYTDYNQTGEKNIALLSKAFCDGMGMTAEKNGQLSIAVSGMRQGVFTDIEDSLTLEKGQKLEATFDASEEGAMASVMAGVIIVMLVLFIILSGYLLIYNIIYISVTKDTRFFGLLKTIGTSPTQLKKLVRNQIYRLSLIGIPVGLALGALTSFAIVPYALKTLTGGMTDGDIMPTAISFNPLIFIGTGFFALLTIALASRHPSRMVAKRAPVEAMNYTGVTQSKHPKDRRTTKGGKPHKMAWYNVFREKKRAILVFLSLFMGTLTFLSVNSFIGSMGVDNYINRYYPNDFVLDNYTSDTPPVDKIFIEKLQKIDGIKKVQVFDAEAVVLEYDEAAFEPMLKSYYDLYYSQNEKEENLISYAEFVKPFQTEKDYAKTTLNGIDTDIITKYNKNHKTNLDTAAFERGEYAMLGYVWQGNEKVLQMIGKELTLTNPTTGKQRTVKIAGVFEYNDCRVSQNFIDVAGMPDGLFVSHDFMKTLFDEPNISSVNINVDQEKEPQIARDISQLTSTLDPAGFELSIKSKVAEEFASSMQGMNVLGGGISILLILIGLINFVNAMLTGVYIRRKELAVLESVGMTKKQIRKMLTFEGFYYAAVSSGLILTLGNLVLWFLAKNITSIVDYAVFHYPYAIITSVIAVIFAICLIVPALVFRTLSKESVTERLHEKQE